MTVLRWVRAAKVPSVDQAPRFLRFDFWKDIPTFIPHYTQIRLCGPTHCHLIQNYFITGIIMRAGIGHRGVRFAENRMGSPMQIALPGFATICSVLEKLDVLYRNLAIAKRSCIWLYNRQERNCSLILGARWNWPYELPYEIWYIIYIIIIIIVIINILWVYIVTVVW